MIEVALSVVAPLAAELSKEAVKKLIEHINQKLVEKGVPKEEIHDLAILDKQSAGQIEVSDVIVRAKEISSHLSAYDELSITSDALSEAHDVTKTLRSERLRQARAAFNAALVLAVLGVLIIFGGIALILFKDATAGGAITTAVGAVVEVVSALLFKFSNDAQNRLDEMGRHLNAIETAQITVDIIDKIEDPCKRDDAIRETAKSLAGLGSAAPKMTVKPQKRGHTSSS